MGWDLSIYRKTDENRSPAKMDSPPGTWLADWHEGWLDWLDELVKEGKANYLGGTGYPCNYTAIAEHLFRRITKWNESMPNWFKPRADFTAIAQCRPDEWLIVTAWDSS